MWKRWGKLGEGSGRVRREVRKINDFRLGEMGEISTVDLAGRPGCRNQDLKMQLPAPSWRSGSAAWLQEARLSDQQRENARMMKDRGWGKKNRDIFRASAPLKRRRTGRCVACRPEGAADGAGSGERPGDCMETGGIAREDPRTGVRSSGCGRRPESAKKAPESGAVVAVSGCVV